MRRRAPINSRPAGCVPDSQPSARRYHPSSKLGRLVRARDGHCKFPGCGVATARCDLDHGQPFDHDNPTAGGPTTAHNLQCLCRWHHCLKTRGDWTVTALPGAVMSWTSPTGTTHETQPHGGSTTHPIPGMSSTYRNSSRKTPAPPTRHASSTTKAASTQPPTKPRPTANHPDRAVQLPTILTLSGANCLRACGVCTPRIHRSAGRRPHRRASRTATPSCR